VAGVCGSPQSSCALASVSKAAAEAACLSQGARLCSEEELQYLEASGSGCGLDAERVWSYTPCSTGAVGGYVTVSVYGDE
ncbi:unnamed protein product, partial [Prorocentrum cordatum]